MERSILAALLVSIGAATPAAAQDAKPVTFNEVAAILNQRCVTCHSGVGAPLGLELDSLAHLQLDRTGCGRRPTVTADTRIDDEPRTGVRVEVRGRVGEDGGIVVKRLRPR